MSSPEPLRVLYVEDDDPLRGAMSRQLRRRMPHLHVDEAATFDQALDVLDRTTPDRLLIDVCLGDYGNTEGLDVLRVARQRGIDAPGIVLTAVLEFAVAREAQRLGAYFLPKAGMSLEELVDVLSLPPPPLAGPVTVGTLRAMAEVIVRAEGALPDKLDALRDEAVTFALDVSGGGHSAAARMLGVPRQYVQWVKRKS